MLCERCGRALRNGVWMPPTKAAIFDRVASAADIGVTTADLLRLPVFADRPVTSVAIKSHVWQLNEILQKLHYRVVSIDRRYVLVTLPEHREAAE
jgi:hypothetical protein